jgi:hypothetical protein
MISQIMPRERFDPECSLDNARLFGAPMIGHVAAVTIRKAERE